VNEEQAQGEEGGDVASRERLADACMPHVWRTVYLSCNGGPDVEDLVQTALMQAFVDLPRFAGKGSFLSWLRRVTVNVVRQHYRRRAVRSLLPFSDRLDGFEARGTASAAQAAEGERFMARLAAHLWKLKEKNRTAVVLSLVDGCSASEIALVVGCGPETAKKRLARGRDELVARLTTDTYCAQLLEELGT